MKALLTGAGGFVGPHLAQHLTGVGDTVVGFDAENGPDLRDQAGWIELLAAQTPDVVYHLAGWSDVGSSWDNPGDTFLVNSVGTQHVLEAARLAGVGRVVIVSSAELYGVVNPVELPLVESHPVQPRSPYGASKQAAEAVALQYHRGFGLEVTIARPFNHLGPGQSTRFVAPAFARQIVEAEVLGGPRQLLHGNLSGQRDYTDVRDVVRAYRLLATEATPGEVYNICSGEAVSTQRLLETLLDLSPATVELRADPERFRPIDLPVLRGSASKLAADTGWAPRYSLTQTLDDVLADARRRMSPVSD
jgi:GDP-4-dehydro-6-deoxy-D-mannose reductase